MFGRTFRLSCSINNQMHDCLVALVNSDTLSPIAKAFILVGLASSLLRNNWPRSNSRPRKENSSYCRIMCRGSVGVRRDTLACRCIGPASCVHYGLRLVASSRVGLVAGPTSQPLSLSTPSAVDTGQAASISPPSSCWSWRSLSITQRPKGEAIRLN